jgi:hypothetical protein
MLCPLYEQIPDWCECALADDSHAVFMREDLTDFFELSFGHDVSLVFAEGWVVEQERFEFYAKGFSPTALVCAEAVGLKGYESQVVLCHDDFPKDV